MKKTEQTAWTDWKYVAHFDINHNAALLEDTLLGERKVRQAKGFRFLFNEWEWAAHKTAAKGFKTDCYDMARAARDDRRTVEIFRNMNGELAARLGSRWHQIGTEVA